MVVGLFFTSLFVGNCLTLPPLEFLEQFASEHGRTSVAFYLPPTSRSTTIAKYWSAMMQSNLPNAYVFQGKSMSPKSFQCFETDLHAFILDSKDLKQSLSQFTDLYNNRTRTSKEFWLVHLDSDITFEDFNQAFLLHEIHVDLDDDLFVSYHTDDKFLQIKELYKIRSTAGFKLTILSYGNYTSGTGLVLSPYKKWERRRDLQGVVMRIAALESVPYITAMIPIQGQPGYFQMEGMNAEVFFALQEIMNFTITLIQPPDMQWGALQSDGSWSGIVHLLQTQQVDFATDFAVTHARTEVISFALPIRHIYHSLFIQNPSSTFNYLAYVEPLHYLAWMMVGIFCLVTPIFIYLIAKYVPNVMISISCIVKFNCNLGWVMKNRAMLNSHWANLSSLFLAH